MFNLKKLFFTFFTCFLTTIVIAQICTGSATRIGGVAFNDFNENGAQDTYEGKQANITVRAYNSAGVIVGSDVTDSDGNWYIDAPIAPAPTVPYRIEFSLPNDLITVGLQPAHNGTNNASDVQFITAATCTVHFGINYAADYCNPNPQIAVPCYVNGNPTGAGTASIADVLVSFAHSECGAPNSNCPPTYAIPGSIPTHIAFNNQLGTVWGEAYNRDSKKLYTSAFLKRHSGLGTLGLDGIYEVDVSTGTPTIAKFVELNDDLGINVGTVLSNTARGLPENTNQVNHDETVFDQVGKVGIGDIDISDDNKTLYVTNLFDQKIYAIDILTKTLKSTITISGTCAGGTLRPYGLKFYHGDLYVGAVCDATISNLRSDLKGCVYKYNGTSIAQVLNFPLDYNKGYVSSNQPTLGNFQPWTSVMQFDPVFRVSIYPQPILSDIEFDSNGGMILGLMDRNGHQGGYNNYGTDNTLTTLYTFLSGGDILRASYSGGTYTIENNGTVGAVTSAGGVGNNQGPGGGEFYDTEKLFTIHEEIAQGALALLAGNNQVISTVMDPFNVGSGGVKWFNNTTGASDKWYEIYISQNNDPSLFWKANGLGDLEALCSAAPIEIGNRLWIDADNDGVQDANESPIVGAEVSLYKADGTLVQTKTTNATGNFYFKDYQQYGTGYDTLTTNTTYYVVVGKSGNQFDTATKKLTISGTDYALTTSNTGQTPNTDQNDNDGTLANSLLGALGTAINGFPYTTIAVGGAGYTNHTLDFGFKIPTTCQTITNPSGNQSICVNTNGTNITIETDQNTPNSIKFVKFNTKQMAGTTPTATEATAIYAGSLIGSTVTPTGASHPYTATYTWNSADFPNATTATITYYVYAIIEPDGGATCQPTQEIQILVSPTVNAGIATNPPTICKAGSGLTNIDLFSQLAGETAGGIWSQIAGESVGAALHPTTGILNPNGWVRGTYTFLYTVTGIVPCPNDTEAVTLTMQECCPPKACLGIIVVRN